MMPNRPCLLLAVLLSSVILAGSGLAKEPVHLSKTAAEKLFPKELVGYKLKDLKIKDKSDAWKEYSATYKTSKKSDKELKLVINDVLPAGDPKWQEQVLPGEDLIGEYPAKAVKDEDKHTVMVLVGKRFRIDFKSRQISPEKLRTMAEAFDYKPAAKVAGAGAES